jgi:hypothetical protein
MPDVVVATTAFDRKTSTNAPLIGALVPASVMVPVTVPVPTPKVTPSLAAPETVTTREPVVAPEGTVVTILVSVHVVGVAVVPLNVTVLVPCVAPNRSPLMVTLVAIGPLGGVTDVMLGL